MDLSVKWINEMKIRRTIDALKENNINGYLVNNTDELIEKIKEIVDDNAKVSCGGSLSLFQTGVIEHLRSGRYEFLDRYTEGLDKSEVKRIQRESFFCDAYFTSSNAVTEDGELYNVDGMGNRVAAMLYGPDKVIFVCGVNKIVKNLSAAINRNKEKCGPINAKRLNKNTPCARIGYCMDCNSNERICNEYTLIRKQRDKDRMHVIFLNEEIGY